MKKFLGRTLNTNTMMYEFSDRSGVSLPSEVVSDIESDFKKPSFGAWIGLCRKWAFEDKMRGKVILDVDEIPFPEKIKVIGISTAEHGYHPHP